MDISPSTVLESWKRQEALTEEINLFYAEDRHLTIERQGERPFLYYNKGTVFDDEERIVEISKLAIPPAWADVRIAESTKAHLQAVGRDAKRRKQYRYHPKWQEIRNRTKFAKMLLFGKHLPQIRAQVEKDLAGDRWSKEKILALIIKLMEETHIRIGNEQYAKHNDTYGLTTLRKRHLSHGDTKLRFEFVGKRGKEHKVTLKNKRLIRLVNQCEEIPGWELFKFFDEDGNKQQVDSGMVNDYIQEHSAPVFSAKDFRTWSASLVFFKHLKKLEIEKAGSKPSSNIIEAFRVAADALGNTPNVCRKYYVHPSIVNGYEKEPSKILNIETGKSRPFLQQSEIDMMEFIKSNGEILVKDI